MKQEIRELDVVALLEDVPAERLTRGETGTVVFAYGDGIFLVEFSDNLGQTYAMAELQGDQLLVLHKVAMAEAI